MPPGSLLGKSVSVFAFGMIGLWEGIPLGLVLGMPAPLVAVLSGLGSTAATLLVAFLGGRLRERLVRGRFASATGAPKEETLIGRIWHRYGVMGLGLLAPCVTGAPVGVAIGFVLKVPSTRLLSWLVAGIALWSVLLTAAGVYGSESIRALMGR